jgi:HAE1 family hydrophobic/amphiphilic exporter-1
MTSLAFGFGVLPLAVATGAGAGAQNAIGTGVLGGMVTATVLVILFAPLFFVLIETFLGKGRKGGAAAAGGENPFFAALKAKLFQRRNRQATGTEHVTPSEDR